MVIRQNTMFIRTAGCDYSCSWCDSAFTWDGSAKEQVRQMAPEEIWNELVEIGGENFSHVTISGGNPVLLKNIQFLLTILKENGIRTAIETQGSKWQEWLLQIEEVTISPKPPSSKMKTDFTMLDSVIHKLERKDFSLKVVVFEDYDFEYAVKVHKRYPQVPFFLQVGNDDTKTVDDAALIKNLLQKYERLIEKAAQCKEMNDAKV
ncbi:7-cyano-7-deazaguanosine (preQ0) biosynthesis protein QueE, partial [Bacillus cereus BAG1O-1]